MKPKRGPARKSYMAQNLAIDPAIVNNKHVPKNVVNGTEQLYKRQLENWDDLVVERLEDLKEFMFRMGMQMKADKRPGEDMVWNGIKSYWKRFTAGYARERGPIPAENIISITHAIHPLGEIGRCLNLKPDGGPRKHATAAKMFARPRLRVDLWALLSLAAYTSARVSDYTNFQTTCRAPPHTVLIAFRNEDGEPEFALQPTKFLKSQNPLSSKLPMPDIHEGQFQKTSPLYLNPMLFHLDKRILNKPIFSGVNGKIMKANAFSKELRELCVRAGFSDPPSLHCFRAEGLTNIDSNPLYSDTQRLKLAGHGNNAIHRQYYASRNPGIDSQAAYLGAPAREVIVAKHFREFEVPWEPALWQSLPLKEKERLEQTEEYRNIRAKLWAALSKRKGHDLNVAGLDTKVKSLSSDESEIIPHPIRKLRRDLQKLEDEELKDLWKNTSTESFAGSQPYVCRGVDRPFSRLRPVLPYRQRLADLLLIPAKLRSPEGREAILALLALYESDSEVERPGLDKSHCSCRNGGKAPKQDRLPVELSWQRVENTFLPGFCPFCLWDASLPATERLKPFCSMSEWEAHICSHGRPWQTTCPDGRCRGKFEDADSFYGHMYDIHRIPERLLIPSAQKDRKRKATKSRFQVGHVLKVS
ncbi:hypothetical protein F5X96DRAFT_679140 [Biscogniauxia mediterranea]|nr:hypothetical protein F5X96DRAFT_679140 [Biscogniauxia mediterranea]